MATVSSPLLVEHAIAGVFESFGTSDVSRVRRILTVIHEEFGGAMPATWVLQRCGCDAVLMPTYAQYSLDDLWAVIKEKEENEIQIFTKRFPCVAQA